MEARAEEFADLESQDTGKPRATLVADEIMQSVDQLRFFAGAARNLEGRSAGEYMAGHTSFVRREPIGVIGQVTPWNYPLNMAVWKVAPAIAAGNTVVLKPSDTTPLSTLLLAEVAAEFLPAGVLNVVTRRPRHGRGPPRAPDPADGRDHRLGPRGHGGRPGGGIRPEARAPRARRQGAGDRVRRRRPREAAEGIATAAYFNAGQDCTAATRVLVHESVHDEFVAALAAATAANARTGGPRRGRRLSARSTTRTSWRASRASSTGCPRTPTSQPAVGGRGAAATSARPPSSPGCGRTTRRCRARSSAR